MPAETSTTTTPAATRRVPYWDNAKWIAMALVVIGHVMQPLALDSNVALVPYLVIYAFHMPLFGVISGYFTSPEPGVKHYRRIITDLIVPYLVFEIIWTIIQSFVRGSWRFDPTTASWTLWFLLALALFRLTLPLIAQVQWPLAWAIAASVAIGYFDSVDQTFSVMRYFGMLPFFVAGWELRRSGLMDRWMDARRTGAIRVAAATVFAIAATLVAVMPHVWRDLKIRHWFFLDRSYAEIADGLQATDGLQRLAVMAVTFVLIAAALVLIPRRATLFSAWGAATMYIYLLHTFVLYWPRESGWLRALAPEWWMTPFGIIAGVAIAVLLSQRVVHVVTGWLVEPRAAWLLRRERAHDARTVQRAR